MRSVQVPKPKGPLEIVEKDIPEPATQQVRIKVQACGICHSDSVIKEGLLPDIEYPRVPGHEIVGVIDAMGKGVVEWKTGQRVGVGWHGGHCNHRILSTGGRRLLSTISSSPYNRKLVITGETYERPPCNYCYSKHFHHAENFRLVYQIFLY